MAKLKEDRQNENRQRYRERHPEKELQWRINTNKRFLEKNGYIVTKVDKREHLCYNKLFPSFAHFCPCPPMFPRRRVFCM